MRRTSASTSTTAELSGSAIVDSIPDGVFAVLAQI